MVCQGVFLNVSRKIFSFRKLGGKKDKKYRLAENIRRWVEIFTHLYYNTVIILQAYANGGKHMGFCEDLKNIRQSRFLSQEAFAKELGVSFATVNRWESGRTKPTYKTMKLIDDFCKKNDVPFDIKQIFNMVE